MLIHGGAWGSGKANDLDAEGKLIAREGWVAFSINYRLADHLQPWPDELTDVQRAIRWIAAHAASTASTHQARALGVSAGGHLASLLGEVGTTVDGTGRTINDPNPPVAVKAVAACRRRPSCPGWSPRPRAATRLHRQQALHPLLAAAAASHFLGCTLGTAPVLRPDLADHRATPDEPDLVRQRHQRDRPAPRPSASTRR